MDRFRAHYEQKDKENILRQIMQKQKGDYYSILGLPRNCSPEDVKRAYMKLSLKVHPDKNKSPDAGEVFKVVSEAYRCLMEQRKLCAPRATNSCSDRQTNFNWAPPPPPPPVRPEKPDPRPGRTVKPDPRPGRPVKPGYSWKKCEFCHGYIYGSGECEHCESNDVEDDDWVNNDDDYGDERNEFYDDYYFKNKNKYYYDEYYDEYDG